MGCSWSSWLPTLLSYSPFRLGLGIGNWSGQHPQVKQWLQRKPLPCLSQLQHPPGRTLLCSAGLYCGWGLLRLCCSIPSRIAASSAFNSLTSVKRLTFVGSSGVLSSTEAPLPLCEWSLKLQGVWGFGLWADHGGKLASAFFQFHYELLHSISQKILRPILFRCFVGRVLSPFWWYHS